MVDRPACLAKASRSWLTFSTTQLESAFRDVCGEVIFRTYLTPKHLAQRPDVMWSGVDVFCHGDGVDGLAYAVPEGGFEALLFFGVGWGRHGVVIPMYSLVGIM
jgi:hypothetical protein